MKHGRKEQFSLTIDSELADKFYEYQEKHNIIYKNMAMEQLIKKAFLHIELMEKYDENQIVLFMAGVDAMRDIALKLAPKNKTLKKAIKVHYETILQQFQDAKLFFDIP